MTPIMEGGFYDVFFKSDERPIRGNPVCVSRFEKVNLVVNATDADRNERIFNLKEFTLKPVVSGKKQQ